jgi:hypothetical protein
MFTQESAIRLARQLDYNASHFSLEQYLNYFTEDVMFISSNVQRLISESKGYVQGKITFKNYLEYSRKVFPYDKFKLQKVEHESNILTLHFYNESTKSFSHGRLFFNKEMKVYKATESYV